VFGRATITFGIGPHSSLSIELSAQNGYPGLELLPGYPVNVAVPTRKVRKKSRNLMWS